MKGELLKELFEDRNPKPDKKVVSKEEQRAQWQKAAMDAPEIGVLRGVRDTVLKQSLIGNKTIDLYYQISDKYVGSLFQETREVR